MSDRAADRLLKDEIFRGMDELTPAEKKVARALLARYPGAGLESAASLAKTAGTSTPTVLRLLSRLDIGSYPEFQQRLRTEITPSMQGSPVSRAQHHLDEETDETPFGQAVAVRERLIGSIAETVPPAEVDRAVALLAARPKHVVVSGGYFSRLMARLLAMQLDQLIRGVDYADEPLGLDVGKYLRCGRDSVVVVFDLRRHELAAKDLVTLAKSRGADVILITDETLSPSAECADVVLPVAVDGVPFDSFAALLVLVEALVDAVFHAVGSAAIARMTDWERSVHIHRSVRTAADPSPGDGADADRESTDTTDRTSTNPESTEEKH